MSRAAYVASGLAAAVVAGVIWHRRKVASALQAQISAYTSSDDTDVNAWLAVLSTAAGKPLDSAEFAAAVDAAEPLREFRDEFHIPPDGAREQAYMAGNSLGLQPKGTATMVGGEMDKWARRGVMGHFEGVLPWATCEDVLSPLFAEMVGAKDADVEVGAMNSLTVNLHLLMAAFYRPTEGRAAILIEAGAFPSDRYAVGSQVKHHGRDPTEWVIEVQPRASDSLLHTEDILRHIDENESRLALVLLGGVNYLTGQVLDMPAIASHMTKLNAARKARGQPAIPFGIDLAHAIGNVPLRLHDWDVDFAAWCTYKYLNSGAGCLAGLFVHEKHATDSDLYPRLSGWWGVPFSKRFAMAHKYEEASGARAFSVSNVNPLMVACVYASLDVYRRAGGVEKTRRKSILLTAYLEALLRERGLLLTAGSAPVACASLRLVTPSEPSRRGAQLSLRVISGAGRAGKSREGEAAPLTMRALEEALRDRYGVIGDCREPDILRISPAPLYNSFGDVRRVVNALEKCLGA
jgi:kynureninase